MKPARILFVLCLTALAARFADGAECADFRVESYSVPASIWIKIPTELRDDHAALQAKLHEQAGKGKVVRRDRIGGPSLSGQEVTFSAGQEVFYPRTLEVLPDSFTPTGWESRHVGSELELTATFGKSARIEFTHASSNPPLVPLMKSGSPSYRERTKYPVFAQVRTTIESPLAPVTLFSVAPDPNPKLRAPHVLASFLLASPLPGMAKPAAGPPGVTIELLGLVGSSRSDKSSPARMMGELLGFSSGFAFSIGATQIPGQRLAVRSGRELPYPNAASMGPNGPLPSGIAVETYGTTLAAHILPAKLGRIPVTLDVDHDLKPPILPTVPGKDGAAIDQSKMPFRLQFQVKRTELTPGTWVLLDEEPLSKALGKNDRRGKDRSCFLFGRVTMPK